MAPVTQKRIIDDIVHVNVLWRPSELVGQAHLRLNHVAALLLLCEWRIGLLLGCRLLLLLLPLQ